MMAMSDADLLRLVSEVLSGVGDWAIVWMDEDYEGWSATLHDTSGCSCHAPANLKCYESCCDPSPITREMADALIHLRLASPVSEATS